MNIKDITKELDQITENGFQLSKQKGIINSTWLLFKKNDFYYLFDINQKVEFTEGFKYTSEELAKEFPNSIFTIDEIIT